MAVRWLDSQGDPGVTRAGDPVLSIGAPELRAWAALHPPRPGVPDIPTDPAWTREAQHPSPGGAEDPAAGGWDWAPGYPVSDDIGFLCDGCNQVAGSVVAGARHCPGCSAVLCPRGTCRNPACPLEGRPPWELNTSQLTPRAQPTPEHTPAPTATEACPAARVRCGCLCTGPAERATRIVALVEVMPQRAEGGRVACSRILGEAVEGVATFGLQLDASPREHTRKEILAPAGHGGDQEAPTRGCPPPRATQGSEYTLIAPSHL